MLRALLLLSMACLCACGSSDCRGCVVPLPGPTITLSPAALTSAIADGSVKIGATVALGSYTDKPGMLAQVAGALTIVPDGETTAIDCEAITTLAANDFDQSTVELKPKQALAMKWHRLKIGAVPTGAALLGPSEVLIYPGHKPTLSKIELCVKVGEGSDGKGGSSQIVDHLFSFYFSEPVKTGTGTPADIIKVTAPTSATGTCEWSNPTMPAVTFTYVCHQYAQGDQFHVVVSPGFVGTEGTAVTTFSGQTSFAADLGPVSNVCSEVQP